MGALHDGGLVEFLNPLEIVDFKAGAFQEGFFDLLFDDGFQPFDAPMDAGVFRSRRTSLHVDKMDEGVFRELERRGLAERNPHDRKWWSLETSIAAVYMAYLAGVVSGARPGMLPVTDQIDPLRRLAQPIKPHPPLAELRYAYIQRALPVPSGPVEPKEMIKFKETFADELRRCRRFLDTKLAEIASIDDPDNRELMGTHLLDEIKDDIATLSEQMARRRWPEVTLKAVCGVGGIGIGAAIALLTLGSPLLIGLGVGAAIGGGVLPVREAFEDWTAQRYDPRAPLTYAALAERAFA
jgi:hypothetical protein